MAQKHLKLHGDKGDDHGELWLVSYADMITLLLSFFIVLYSFSKDDDKNFASIQTELRKTFSPSKSPKINDSPSDLSRDGDGDRQAQALQVLASMMNFGTSTDLVEATLKKEAQKTKLDTALTKLSSELKNDEPSTKQILQGGKEVFLEVVLPERYFFRPGSSDLLPESLSTIATISKHLRELKDLVQVDVQGHTDSSPPSSTAAFPDNWALSAARAGKVAAEMIRQGMPRPMVRASGLADLVPLFPERDARGALIPENCAKNRRVQIMLRTRGHALH